MTTHSQHEGKAPCLLFSFSTEGWHIKPKFTFYRKKNSKLKMNLLA